MLQPEVNKTTAVVNNVRNFKNGSTRNVYSYNTYINMYIVYKGD